MKKIKYEMLLVCVMLFLAITLQARTIIKNKEIVAQSFGNSELKENLIKAKEKYDNMVVELEKSTKKLEEIRKKAEENVNSEYKLAEKLKENDILIGLTDVKGEGITIVAKDATPTIATDDLNQFLVHDSDLRELINELANAGAEAIEINGQRIVISSCITCAGNVITINGERISSPFTIKAIGNSDVLYGALMRPGGYIQIMQEKGLIQEVKKSKSVSISKYKGTIEQKYIKTKGE